MLKGKVTVDRRHRLKAQADTITRVLRVAGLLELAACTFAVAWPDPLALAGRLAQHSARLSRTAHQAATGGGEGGGVAGAMSLHGVGVTSCGTRVRRVGRGMVMDM